MQLFICLWDLQGAFIKGGGGPGAFGRMSQGGADPRSKEEIQTVVGGPSTWSNPTGRVSVQFAPGAVSLGSLAMYSHIFCRQCKAL